MRSVHLLAVGVGLLIGLTTAAPPAAATVVEALTLLEKTQRAPLVVHVRAERIEPVLEDNGGAIETRVTFVVLEALKGDAAAGQLLIVRQSGGKIGSFEHHVPGVSKWTLGEEAIMFLEPVGAMLVELGIGIGKYGVEYTNGEAMVTHDPQVAVAKVRPNQPLEVTEAERMTPEPIRAFKKRVRSYARGITAPTPTTDTIRTPKPALPDPR